MLVILDLQDIVVVIYKPCVKNLQWCQLESWMQALDVDWNNLVNENLSRVFISQHVI